ncbi:MAG: 5-formyltetrahydrofolate cyclo-ligase [Thermodesulfobacteriota bacterium]|nr:5-formyltetrahydrofolate cyclo-ligase [Thermodesulfobacteriota bacterium]
MSGNKISKDEIRRLLLEKRLALGPGEVREQSEKILAKLRGLAAWQNATQVLLYMPVKNEVDVSPLLEELWAKDAAALIPRCRPGEPGEMDIVRVRRYEDIRSGAYGIPEPKPNIPAEEAWAPDLALVPGVAFDRRGTRLGFGGGYFDRLLAGRIPQKTVLVGPAYAFQVVDELPADPWDVRVHAVITQGEILWT